LLLVRWLLAW